VALLHNRARGCSCAAALFAPAKHHIGGVQSQRASPLRHRTAA
jgi:hypothetical protein